MESFKVAVIGGGMAGLSALKTMREVGFDAVLFERRNQLGGLWSYSGKFEWTSVIRRTRSNTSRFTNGFSDFPYPVDGDLWLEPTKWVEFNESYATYFSLWPHIRFNSEVKQIVRDLADKKWEVHVMSPVTSENNDEQQSTTTQLFDKVLVCSGTESKAVWPSLPGRDRFKGTVIHGQGYKGAAPFANKNVVIVGLGLTAADVAEDLAQVPTTEPPNPESVNSVPSPSLRAKAIYLAHRHGNLVLPRKVDGLPVEAKINWFSTRLVHSLVRWLGPNLVHSLLVHYVEGEMRKIWSDEVVVHRRKVPGDAKRIGATDEVEYEEATASGIPEGLLPAKTSALAIASDNFMTLLRSGELRSVAGFRRFVGSRSLELDDGTVLEDIDAVVCCTGYNAELAGLLPCDLDFDGAAGLPLLTSVEVLRREAEQRARMRRLEMVDPGSTEGTADLSEHEEDMNADGEGPSAANKTKPIPRLWQSIFHERYPDSMAFTNCCGFNPPENVVVRELVAMAIAQLWASEAAAGLASDHSPVKTKANVNRFPSAAEMAAEIDGRHSYIRRYGVSPKTTLSHLFMPWLHATAGTGLYERLEGGLFSFQTWHFWWTEPKLYRMLRNGPMSPYAWRLFETNSEGVPGLGRKSWPGAKAALLEVNESWERFCAEAALGVKTESGRKRDVKRANLG